MPCPILSYQGRVRRRRVTEVKRCCLDDVHRDRGRGSAAVLVLDVVIEGVLPGSVGGEGDHLVGGVVNGSCGSVRTGRHSHADCVGVVEQDCVTGIRVGVVIKHVKRRGLVNLDIAV